MWTVLKSTELRYQEGRSNKFYRVTILSEVQTLDYRVLTQWGRIGSEGQEHVELFTTEGSAVEFYRKRIDEKERKGYWLHDAQAFLDPTPALLEKAGVRWGVVTPATIAAPTDGLVDKAAGLLADISDANRGVAKLDLSTMMDRYEELVKASEDLETQAAEAKAAVDMALTAVLNVNGVT